jgi:NAD(P)H-quinone oxidoreductase subunit 5
MALSCATFVAALVLHGVAARGTQLLSYGAWSGAHEGSVAIEFLVDRLSLAFAALSTAIAGVVSAFSNRYLHREPGYNRYFVLLAMFVTGMLFVALAGNVEVLFIGWELVGLSSALLVGFFHERPAPVANALRVFSVYRISDAAMLSAAVLLRHVAGTDSLSLLFGRGRDLSTAALSGGTAMTIALLLLAGPLIEHVPAARLLAGTLGAATAIFAAIATRVQSDVKSSLAYAALTQVGLIVVEIALGWYTIAFVHLAGHACFRLLQFLSAPNVLHDLHGMEDALGDRPGRANGFVDVVLSDAVRRGLFLAALERGFLDSILDRWIVEPFERMARALTRLDRWLCGALVQAPEPAVAGEREDRDE